MPPSHFFLGSVYAHGFGRLDQAVAWFEKAAELDPGNPSYSLVLGGTYVDLGNLVEARRWLDQATKHGAEYEDVATVESLLDLYEGAPARMARTSRTVLEVNPRNPHALNLLRATSLQAGQYASIRDLYARAFPELAIADPPAVDGSNYEPAVDFACLIEEDEAGAHEAAVERLDTIPGVARETAEIIVSEIGIDMSRFPTADHLASWAGVAPGNNESAGKRLSGRTTKGNEALVAALTQAAWAASHTKNTYLSAQYRRIAASRGRKKAIVAVAHSILIIAYHLVKNQETYRELGADFFDKRKPQTITKGLVRRLERLGYNVTLEQSLPIAG